MTTLMFAVEIPNATDDDDPDEWADTLVRWINNAYDGTKGERVMVSLWPFPQWFHTEAMDEMRALAAELKLRHWSAKDGFPDSPHSAKGPES